MMSKYKSRGIRGSRVYTAARFLIYPAIPSLHGCHLDCHSQIQRHTLMDRAYSGLEPNQISVKFVDMYIVRHFMKEIV